MTRFSFSEAFEQSLLKQKLIVPGDKVFVACSGGPDSVALFHLLKELAPRWQLKLGLLHLNHGLRGKSSDRDEVFVRKLARCWGLPAYAARANVRKALMKENLSLEEAARKIRYDFFVQTARRHDIPKIALAHTRDDQSETVLMRVLQGTGLRGLCGIRPALKMGKLWLVRPLLEFSKEDLLRYLKAGRISFRKDLSNQSMKFLRNRLRSQVIPYLRKTVNPRVSEALARLPRIASEESRMLEALDQEVWKKSFKSMKRGRVCLRRETFLKLPASLQFRLLDRSLKKIDKRSGLAFEAWDRLRSHLGKKTFRTSLPRDIDFELTSSTISLYKKARFSRSRS